MLCKLFFLITYLYSAVVTDAFDFSRTKNKFPINSSIQICQVYFEIENEVISLNLKPLTHNVYSLNTSMMTVESDKNDKTGHVFKKINSISTNFGGKFYEDFTNKAIVYESNDNYYDGVCGEGLKKKTIHSISKKLCNSNVDEEIPTVNTKEKKISTIDSLTIKEDFIRFQKMDRTLEILYPKLLLVVEWNYFNMIGGNNFDAIKYLSIFWNAVNLKFKEISTPKINIVISGIVMSKDDAALSFVNKSRSKQNPNKLEDLKLVSLGNQYFGGRFKRESNFDNYDSAVLMTNMTAGSVLGITIRGQICDNNIIYITDDGNFGGIIKAAHELGHSLGLSHDDKNLRKSASSTSVMRPYITSSNEYYWSQKSLDQIQAFRMTRQASCLKGA